MDRLPAEIIIKILQYLPADFLITTNVFNNIINQYPEILTKHHKVLDIQKFRETIAVCNCPYDNPHDALMNLIDPEPTCETCFDQIDYKSLFRKGLIATTLKIEVKNKGENEFAIPLCGDIVRNVTLKYENGRIESICIRPRYSKLPYSVSFYRVNKHKITTSDLYLPVVGSGFTSHYICYTGNPRELKVTIEYNMLSTKPRSKIGRPKYQFYLYKNSIIARHVNYAFQKCESLQTHVYHLPLM